MEANHIARVCHEANRAYALATGEDPSTLHPGWDECPEEIRQSSISGVHHVLRGETPEMLHNSWCVEKRDNGWTYGEVRDNAKKKHPCLVPYNNLPEGQQVKDALFQNIVNALK